MNYTIDLGSLILHSFAAFAIAGYISAGYSRLAQFIMVAVTLAALAKESKDYWLPEPFTDPQFGVGDLIATVGAAGLLALYATVKSLRS